MFRSRLSIFSAFLAILIFFSAATGHAQSPLFRGGAGLGMQQFGGGWGFNPYGRGLISTVSDLTPVGLSYQALWGSGNAAFANNVGMYSSGGTSAYITPTPAAPNGGAGAMQGKADAVNGKDRFLFEPPPNQPQDKAKAQADNGRRAMDEYLYEDDHSGSADEEQERLRLQGVRRSLTGASTTEILTGKALNDLLDEIRIRTDRSVGITQGLPPVPLDKINFRHINVTTAPGLTNMAVLRDDGILTWPATLKADGFQELRELVAALTTQIVTGAKTGGHIAADQVQQFAAAVDTFQTRLKQQARNLNFEEYSEAKAYLNHLESAAKALAKPDAVNFFNGKYTLTAKTVPELLKQMTENKLHFAGALPGDEASYKAMHQALALYSQALINQTGGI
jgi:hypothetical protein